MRRVALLLLALVLPAATAGAADRSFPGRDGAIVFASDRGEALAPQIFAIGADGRGRAILSSAEHTELYPVPSPDGSKVAFLRTIEGELWAMNADGGGKHLLARNARGGSWAPDGSAVAFVLAGRIATVPVGGGEPRQLADGAAPQWSPAGDWIAFAGSPGLSAVWLVRPDGSGLHRLATTSSDRGVAFAWRPDGGTIAYVDYGARTSPTDVGALRLVGVDGSGGRALTSGQSIDSQPSWSRDGKTLAFVTGTDLRAVGADGTGATRLAGGASLATPSWSPDGTLVAFAGLRADGAAGEVRVVRPDGSGLRAVTHESAHFALVTGALGGADGGPAFTRDGRILYAGWLIDNDRDLYVARGGRVTALTGDDLDDTDPSWSPDGAAIAFARQLSGSDSEVYVVSSTGSGLHRLTRHAGEDTSPTWSPDGSRLVFVRRAPGGGLAIATMQADGTHARLLTGGKTLDAAPAWSPDGRRIAFVRDLPGGVTARALFVMDADGTHARRVATVPGATHVQWSPDGVTLAVARITACGVQCTEAAVWLVPAAGGRAREIVGEGIDAAWSPDGHLLVVEVRGDLRVVTLRGATVRRTTSGAGTDDMPDWQPLCTGSGSARGDRLAGTARQDVLCGLGGADRIAGGPGSDRLFGGDGDDTIDARDGAFDVVGCGPGRDTVIADSDDLVGVDCELVRRGPSG